jgi:hypothetical protein
MSTDLKIDEEINQTQLMVEYLEKVPVWFQIWTC